MLDSRTSLIDIKTSLLEMLDWSDEEYESIMNAAKYMLSNADNTAKINDALLEIRDIAFHNHGQEVADLVIEILLREALLQIDEEIEA